MTYRVLIVADNVGRLVPDRGDRSRDYDLQLRREVTLPAREIRFVHLESTGRQGICAMTYASLHIPEKAPPYALRALDIRVTYTHYKHKRFSPSLSLNSLATYAAVILAVIIVASRNRSSDPSL